VGGIRGSASTARVKERAFANGPLCYPMGGTIDGRHGNHVLLAPPFIVSEAEVQTIANRHAVSIDEALAS
jgi:adenosylmethionine-8-amino-7-oxononanoate aminotransferase